MPASPEQIARFSRRIKDMQNAGLNLSNETRLRVYRVVESHRSVINDAIRQSLVDDGKVLPSSAASKVSDVIRAESDKMAEEIRLVLNDAQVEAIATASTRAQMFADTAELEGLFFSPSAELALTAQRYAADLVVSITPELMAEVNPILGRAAIGGISPFEAMKQVDLVIGKSGTGGVSYQAERLVRTEVNRIYSVALDTQLQGIASHMPSPEELEKTWVSGPWRPGRREGHQRMNGQTVKFHEKFFNEDTGIYLMYPHDPDAPVSEVANCGCGYVLNAVSVAKALV